MSKVVKIYTQLADDASDANIGEWCKWRSIGHGRKARAMFEYDQDRSLCEDDCNGSIKGDVRGGEPPTEMYTWPFAKLTPEENAQIVQLRLTGESEWAGEVLELRGGHEVTIEEVTENGVTFSFPAIAIGHRHGQVWWQPPADAIEDPKVFAAVEKYVSGYYSEHWCYVGVIVEVEHPPCAHCGQAQVTTASLWGIESDAKDYFPEVVRDLVHEAIHGRLDHPPLARLEA